MGNSTSQSEQVRSVKNRPIVVRVKRNTSTFKNKKRNSDIPKSISVKDQKDPKRTNHKNRQTNISIKRNDQKSRTVKNGPVKENDHKNGSISLNSQKDDNHQVILKNRSIKKNDSNDLKSESLKNQKGGSVKENDRKKWKNEEICRNVLEDIFMQEFPSVRPDFLVNPYTGKNLELDCYNAELRLACEYNGKQHYMYTPFFHNSEEDFIKQVYRDNLKKRLCYENDIELISVPYFMNEQQIRYYIEHSILNYVEHLILSEKLRNINLKNCVLLNHYLRARDRFKIED